MRNFLFILLALCTLSPVQAQDDSNNIPVGTWRFHAPYLYSLHLAINTSDGKVYSCSPEGLLYADPSEGTGHGLTTLDGLASTQFSTLAYDATTQSILIAYTDGNLDILRGNTLTNINDIVRSTSIVGSKAINHILINNGKAYLSADFGVSVLNLQSLNIEETWKNLSSGSVENPIFGATLTSDQDSIFLCSQNGMLSAKLAPGINLMDFNNWKLYGTGDGLPATGLVATGAYNGVVYAGYTQNGIYALSGTQWILTNAPITSGVTLRSMRNSSTGVLVSANDFVVKISSPTAFTYTVAAGQFNPADCDIDANGTIWLSDKNSGLWSTGTNGNKLYWLNGPAHNRHFKLHSKYNNLVSCAGAYDKAVHQPTFSNDGYYEFVKNDMWHNNSYFYSGLASRDLIDAEYSPDGKLYLASYLQGLYVRAANGTYTLLDHTNSNLKETSTGNGETRVSGLAMDSHNNLWISNVCFPLNTTIHKLSPSGVWSSYTPTNVAGSFPLEITIDEKDNKWIILTGTNGEGNGIMVFNESPVQKERYLSNNVGSGDLPSNAVYTLAIDHDGHLWAGTAEGVAVLYNASTYLTSPKDFTQPYYAGFPLLFDRIVYDIVIDGGNRKWIGTDNGIWLMNEDCSRIITTFNTDNSPLISNYILDMELNTTTGELFIATDKGLMSFRSDATTAAKDYSNVKVFPNPVKPGFSGYVTVSGLVENSTVKITDITGQLVFEAQSNGGTASWNLYDYSGKRARSGVYLVFLSDEEGTQTQIAQFAVVE